MGTPDPPLPLRPESLPEPANPEEDNERRKFRHTIMRRILIGVGAIALVPPLLYFSRTGLPKIWEDLHIVNFVVAAIPTVLSILFAFIIDKDLERHMKIWWRVAIVVAGLLYSTFLWHQQDLTDKQNVEQTSQAIGSAVQLANSHSDEKLTEVQRKVEDLSLMVNQNANNFIAQIGRTETDLSSSIGKVGKAEPPEPAILVFSLWDSGVSLDSPALQAFLQPDEAGNFIVDFTVGNSGPNTAKNVDIWVQVCDVCSFAKEPNGFEHPAGTDGHIRHRRIGDLNPGVNFEKMTILVKTPRIPSFQVAFRSTCETCGGKMSKNQLAVIQEEHVGRF